jgi:hypothetical protein
LRCTSNGSLGDFRFKKVYSISLSSSSSQILVVQESVIVSVFRVVCGSAGASPSRGSLALPVLSGGTMRWWLVALICCSAAQLHADEPDALVKYQKHVEPLIEKYCIGCHSNDSKKGGISFETDKPATLVQDQEMWSKALADGADGDDASQGEEATER